MKGPKTARMRRGDGNVATLLTWFLPGAGHLYMGRVAPAVFAFLLVEGLYALGWYLSAGRGFEFLDPELRGPFATVLTPEVANLGAMIAQLRSVGFGAEQKSPYPPGIFLGSWLTALSGFANVAFMVHANLTARGLPPEGTRREVHPVTAVVATWCLPGLGHWLQGRRLRAVLVFTLLVGFFALGTWMAQGSNLSRERHFYYWSGQFLLGLPSLVTEFVSGRPPVNGEIPLADVGLLFASLPGLLNVLAMLDVFGVAERRWRIEPAPSARGQRPSSSARGEATP